MSNTQLLKYGMYLGSLMGHGIRGTEPQMPWEDFDWDKLYNLACHHNVVGIIEPALSKLNLPEDFMSKIKYHCQRLIAREARQDIEAQMIFDILKKENIPFIKLKGIALKNHYPVPYMRTSADVDICMSMEDRIRSKEIMLSLGYKLDSSIDYHDEYSKGNFFIFELHSAVTRTGSQFYTLFSDPFQKSVPDGDSIGLVFNDEYFYLNLVTHLHQHFVSAGCGMRLFSDLYVFERTHPEMDMSFVRSMLKKHKILEFYDNMCILTQCFLENKPLVGKYEDLAEYIIKSGEYGIGELKRISWLSKDKSSSLTFFDKVKYFMGNWFPGVSVMSKKHPVLLKAPILLPWFWIKRVFYTLFFKRNALKEQRDAVRRMNSDEMKKVRDIHNMAETK